MHLDRTSRRILGSLIEKRYSTPELYPLTLNAVVLAANQKSNRDPEMQLEEFLVEGCLKQLRVDGWVTIVERDFGRSVRYAERMSDQIGLSQKEAAILAELMLRGPQTEQELQRRCERMVKIASVEETVALLDGMAARQLVVHLPREVGQRIARWKHLLTPPAEEAGPAAAVRSEATTIGIDPSAASRPTEATTVAAAPVSAAFTPHATPAAPHLSSAPDVAALRREVESLRAEIAELRDEVAELRASHAAPAIDLPRRPGSPYV